MKSLRRHFAIAGLISVCLIVIFIGRWGASPWAERVRREVHRIIKIDKSAIRPDDGDTFFYRDLPIRVLGIDTPEIIHEEHGIFEDQPHGRAAAAFTARALKDAEVVKYLPFQPDKYGRLLAHVFVDNELLAVLLIRAGLAYETVSYYGDNGFPELAEEILNAARQSPRPSFEEPYRWRRKHQVRK
ncbi:MAG TPA: thermonuclease family protein [Desulfatiglandales bacterium]|nr:thermonuclease family protein [Desulfatiglandales bacterium]